MINCWFWCNVEPFVLKDYPIYILLVLDVRFSSFNRHQESFGQEFAHLCLNICPQEVFGGILI